MDISPEQQSALSMFQEVTANARDESTSLQILKSCNWNVEQALQLHWATGSDIPTQTQTGLGATPLAAPLLGGGGSAPAPRNNAAAAVEPEPAGLAGAGYSFVSWIARGIKSIGSSVLGVLFTFIFGPGASLGGNASGSAFRRALTSSYGNDMNLPEFFEGGFSAAVSNARQQLKLLVVFLHSNDARYGQSFCTDVLGNDFIREMLNENFIVYGGDVARMEAHQVAQMIRVRQFPSFCVLLPASVEEIRVIGALHGQISADQVTGMLTACLEEMESHRSELLAQQVQHQEDRSLREQQDREYQEALEMDRIRAEQKAEEERQEREARQEAEEQMRKEQEAVARAEAERKALQDRRATAGQSMMAPGPECTSRIALRLPAGQRLDRKFLPSATLADVYAWADCAAYLPENLGKDLDIPQQFVLKTSFPTAELKEMDRTVEELKLAGSNILLAAIEDDDL
mmetsp:Transcript_71647/g.126493  ORF Transcript_71647/g.126493 Transcript_71647/m.126493 type:complete len:458 (-) Transcript_71647:196-1569(-)|eukprot:CAMPEP_0197698392 /NCGR_PEP_ID=MMETSP1338-20131121/119281_1 /TAXON_ID=43686 ORGANISM="Pelagodinium beii, Strain RCC1491" /NCGR_SAMPLE_ID=MMETSP1338 /ASSEMBLY_ACC=CAM_ASM_000754 /LENGTH=457 /DNA_ID=CAMNT_0043281781 /DNA_START=114 /DNA_END=1487 /DNA_ORIENTATION=-